MTFSELFQQLSVIDEVAFPLLEKTGFHSDDGLGDSVCALPDAAQDAFLRSKAEELLESLELLHEELCYLEKPVLGERRLKKLPNGRYGYTTADGTLRTFCCGAGIEAKIHDRFGKPRWVRTRFEHDGSDYYLVGGGDVSLAGLTVRERGRSV